MSQGSGPQCFTRCVSLGVSSYPYFHLSLNIIAALNSTILTVNLPHKAFVTKNSNTIVVGGGVIAQWQQFVQAL